MTEDNGCCSNDSCGCHLSIYPTDKTCPDCGKHLRLEGRAQTLEYRLSCGNCGYQSPLLSRMELADIL